MNFIYQNIFYIGAFGLIFIGLFILSVKKNLIKLIIGLNFIGTGINLFLISIGYVNKGTAPIFSKSLKPSQMVDPIPQALVLTAIVINVAILALALSLVIRLYKHYGTLNIRKIKGLKW